MFSLLGYFSKNFFNNWFGIAGVARRHSFNTCIEHP